MSAPIIAIDRLVKSYAPDRRAVDELTLDIYPGEIFGFLGPNGAGKTSTLKILTTLTLPTSGTAMVSGINVVDDPRSVRARIGYVGQQTGVDMALTGRENLILQGRLYHLTRAEIDQRTEELFNLFDLSECADWRVGGYSGGMRRKLDIATALIHRPKVLFLDEPTLGLDPQSRNALWGHIVRLNREFQTTIFLTTHYLEEADRLSHRLAIIDQGKVRAMGTSEALKDTLAGDGIHVTFDEEVPVGDLDRLQKTGIAREVIQEGKEIHLYLENGREALPKFLQLLEAIPVSVKTVSLSRPSLDDVFLKYTGHSLDKVEEGATGGNPWWPGGGGGDWQKWQKKWQKNGQQIDASPPEGEATAEHTPSGSSEKDASPWREDSKGEQSQSWGQGEWDKRWEGKG